MLQELVKLCVGTCLGRDLIPPEPQQMEDKRPFGWSVGWLVKCGVGRDEMGFLLGNG